MSQEAMRKFKFFFAWQDEEEEVWLRDMSQTGWHMESAQLPGIYTFRRGEPMDYVYRLDYRREPRGEFLSYLQLFSDAGWDYLDEMNHWQYFRKLARPDDDPEIYTDSESKIAKYQRVRASMMVPPFIFFIFIAANFDRYPTAVAVMFLSLTATISVLYAMAFVRVTARINKLKRS